MALFQQDFIYTDDGLAFVCGPSLWTLELHLKIKSWICESNTQQTILYFKLFSIFKSGKHPFLKKGKFLIARKLADLLNLFG